MRAPDFELKNYLRRWYAFPARPKSRWNIALHHILAPDPGPDTHCHAAWSISIPIWRCYRERFQDGTARVMFPGRIAFRPAEQLHQIIKVSEGGCWTIWIRGGHRRVWGFMTSRGWVPHWAYDNEERSEERA